MGRNDSPKKALFPIYDILEGWQAFAFATPEVKPQHHALYQALVYQVKVRGGLTRFPLAYQYGMQVSAIKSKDTYYDALKRLHDWGFIVYEPGANAHLTPIVEVAFQESTRNLVGIYLESTRNNKEVVRLEGNKVKEKEREEAHEKSLSLLQAEISGCRGELQAAQFQLQEAQKKIAELEQKLLEQQEKSEKKIRAPRAAKNPAAPKSTHADKLTDMGRRLADAWVTWMQKEHSSKTASLDKLTVFDVSSFNEIADSLAAKLHKDGCYSENGVVASLVSIMLRQKEQVREFNANSLLKPVWFAKQLAELISNLERSRPGSVSRPTANSLTPTLATEQAQSKADEGLRRVVLQKLNAWLLYHRLPQRQSEAITPADVALYQKALTGKRDYEGPHPQETHYAAEWLARNHQPINA